MAPARAAAAGWAVDLCRLYAYHAPVRYAELHAVSAFSFLRGASEPETLVERAAALGIGALAVTDRNGVYGAPRLWRAARAVGVKPLFGAEIRLEGPLPPGDPPLAPVLPGTPASGETRLTLLAVDARGWRNLCRLLTAAAAGRPKGEAVVSWSELEAHAGGLLCLTGGGEGPLARALEAGGAPAAARAVDRLAGIFPGRLAAELQRHGVCAQEHRNLLVAELARRHRLPLVATGGVRYARAEDRDLADVLTAVRLGVPLGAAGRRLEPNRERHLRSPREMAARFPDHRRALEEAAALAERIELELDDVGYRFPEVPVPPGETTISHLRALVRARAPERFRPLTERARRQLERELDLIGRLGLAGYFLLVHGIVEFCRREGIMVQGRGSAANSAVCYALGITAVDPVRMELLFERFLSEERGEWPDIDLDLPSGERREWVIRHVYRTYGPHGAAMTGTVITWRERSAARDLAKALGLPPSEADRIARRIGRGAAREFAGGGRTLAAELAALELDPEAPALRHFRRLWPRMLHLPRHTGQHSGGMVLAAGRLDETVPMEPAAMPGRTVIQWDKDDCADLGIIKVDLLGLGMLAALEEAIPLVREHEGVGLDLAHLPPDDPETYRMIRRADTVGVFQIESRAQMASLPRNAPRRFYDLVVQVAIIRPGPITGRMTHPYLERRQGRQPVTVPHPCLEPILRRTLGVPIFQEQLLRMAMAAAGFSGGEAEELRRAMGFKRSTERMRSIEARLREGMAARGITGRAQEEIVRFITSFALYGFPESHAASFALIVYASAYLKAHHPAAFYTALLNAWPMGFYAPATLVRDAARHGAPVRPVDVARSGWRCRWEDGGVRLGLRYVRGLGRAAGETVEAEAARRPFASVADLAARCRLGEDDLARLAHAGALASLGLARREALWQASLAARSAGPLFEETGDGGECPLPAMTPWEETVADYTATGLTTGDHVMAHLREALDRRGVLPTTALARRRDGERVRCAGVVIVRQRPATARGFLFLTLEDEHGMVQAVVRPELFRRRRAVLLDAPALLVEGTLQRRGNEPPSIRAARIDPLDLPALQPSHDFH